MKLENGVASSGEDSPFEEYLAWPIAYPSVRIQRYGILKHHSKEAPPENISDIEHSEDEEKEILEKVMSANCLEELP